MDVATMAGWRRWLFAGWLGLDGGEVWLER